MQNNNPVNGGWVRVLMMGTELTAYACPASTVEGLYVAGWLSPTASDALQSGKVPARHVFAQVSVDSPYRLLELSEPSITRKDILEAIVVNHLSEKSKAELTNILKGYPCIKHGYPASHEALVNVVGRRLAVKAKQTT